jgi:hypothetical protein
MRSGAGADITAAGRAPVRLGAEMGAERLPDRPIRVSAREDGAFDDGVLVELDDDRVPREEIAVCEMEGRAASPRVDRDRQLI